MALSSTHPALMAIQRTAPPWSLHCFNPTDADWSADLQSRSMMTSKNSTEFNYQESVVITGGIYSLYKKGTFLWPTEEQSCVVKIGGKNRAIWLKSISKLKEDTAKATTKKATIKKMEPTEEEELLEMQYLLEKTNLTKQKIDKVQEEIKLKVAEMDKLHEELGELMMLLENAHENYKHRR